MIQNRAATSFVVGLCAAGAARAQDFLSVPEVATPDPAPFRALFSRARFGPGLHALLVGDSQETCPLGMGQMYVPAFNAQWARRYGVSPRTPLVQAGGSFGWPGSEWLAAGDLLAPSDLVGPPAVSPDALPGLACWTLRAPAAGGRGWALWLQPRAEGVSDALPIDRGRSWLATSQGVYLDVFALRPPAGDVRAVFSVVPVDEPDGEGQVLGVAATSLAVMPDTGPVARQRIGPVAWDDHPGVYLRVELTGLDHDAPARLVSASLASVGADVGLTATDIAAGGYSAASLTHLHAEALPHLRALGVDAAFISLGANDLWAPPQQFKQNLSALIGSLRANTSATLPVVLLSDPYRGYASPEAEAWAEQFPRVCAELAAELPAVCAVNSRRLTHQRGWVESDIYGFTTDRVHYNTRGAELKSSLEVGALWESFVCLADVGVQGGAPGADGELDNNDFVAFIDAFFAERPVADTGGQGGLRGADGRFDNNDFIVFIGAFFDGCP